MNRNIKLKASITVEMAYVLPTVILLLLLTIYTVFYYHDKNVLIGAAGETAILGAQMERQKEENKADLHSFYRERVKGKLIFLHLTGIEVSKNKGDMAVTAQAGKGRMRVSVVQKAVIPEPEKDIRRKQLLDSLTEQEKEKE
ncbi:TadE/TadG family type IV pilus assembly protein [Muricomes intestini]|uniref:TadE-like protein n=2 Tax=Muricomes intestini TaxID=1796634 RepID=A0A4R3K934_9FIRM|nr:TadE/TadG family type IV pilus assembly protein [Muricomes intestini]TCS79460.1 TadE-like protein [Muricomes intestini]HAX51293.1 pilus assembly protein [Lachnospiraceae bacterium]HCR82525.1 pilus assembly protein [Lachnospiraceae bacterium]